MLRRVVAAPLLVGLALATSASAGEPTDTLRRLFEHANRIILAPDLTHEARVTALRGLVREAFDARTAAALALGPEWQVLTPAEREEFSRLYGDVIESAYLGGVGSRARLHGDGIRVAFASESVQGTRAAVLTTVETRSGDAMPIEYRLSRRDRGWAVVDVVVDGLSLTGSYRAQIQRVMQGGTYVDLVARLREKASTTTLAAIAAAKTKTAAAVTASTPPLTPALEPPAPEIAPAPVLVASAAAVSDAPPAGTPVAAINPVVTTPVPAPPAAAEATPTSASDVKPSSAAPVSPPRRSFWIQVGAFRDTDAASRLVERMRRYSVMVATGGQRLAPLARVLVGPFTNRAAAASTMKDLAAGGYRAFIAVE